METKDVLTVLGIVTSLGFNLVNLFRTNKLRSDTLRLDEFKRLRTPVDAAILSIKSHRSTLRGLEASGKNVVTVRKDVAECNQAILVSYDDLCDALVDMDKSQHIVGSDWCTCVSNEWDDVLSAFDGAYVREKQLPAIKLAISRVIEKIDILLTVLHGRLDKAIK